MIIILTVSSISKDMNIINIGTLYMSCVLAKSAGKHFDSFHSL